ncbi:MAG: DnaJ like chaperone protein [Cyclobacteriaceae bacterium]|jgi:DnaJ like chaperone protein
MRVIGKIVGGTLGYVLGGPFAGPWAALAGIALGHQLLDRPPREFFGVALSERDLKNSVFFTATFAMLGKLAQADGRVSDTEFAAVRAIIQEKFKLSSASADQAYHTFTDSVGQSDSFETHARAFYSQFRDAPEALASMLEVMLILAHADFDYDANEESLIKSAATIFGLADEYPVILAVYQSTPDNLEHCYQLLDLSMDAGDNDVQQRYEHLLREHDPQLLLAEGVPQEMTAIAADKHAQIQLAYEHIQQSRRVRSGVSDT